MEWISVKDRLPELKYTDCEMQDYVTKKKYKPQYSDRVLVASKWPYGWEYYTLPAYRVAPDKPVIFYDAEEDIAAHNVTHWMPIEPPKEDKENGKQ